MRFRSVFLLLLLLALPHRAFSPYADFTSNPTDTDPNSNNNSNSSSLNLANSTATTRTFLRDIHELSIYTGQSFGYPLILSDLPGQRLTIVGARLAATSSNSTTPRSITISISSLSPSIPTIFTARADTPMVSASRATPKSFLTTTSDANPSSLLQRHADPCYPPNQSHLRFQSRPHHRRNGRTRRRF